MLEGLRVINNWASFSGPLPRAIFILGAAITGYFNSNEFKEIPTPLITR